MGLFYHHYYLDPPESELELLVLWPIKNKKAKLTEGENLSICWKSFDEQTFPTSPLSINVIGGTKYEYKLIRLLMGLSDNGTVAHQPGKMSDVTQL